MISKLSFKISNKDSNKSISSFLSAFYLGKEKIYKLELNSCLFINDKKAFTRSILKENDILTIIIDEEINVAPCGDDLEVVYEDEHFLFVNKPKNMLVHDDGTKQEITLSNLVAKYYKNKRIHRMVRFSNRLDYETSGIVVFSKNEIAHAYLDALIRERKVSKKYYAVCYNYFSKKEGSINQNIARDRHNSQKMIIHKNGKEAISNFKVIKNGKISLVDVEILTGRTHQIRVHLAYLNHPLLGDKLYGKEDNYSLMLQAYLFEFKHPFTNQKLSIRIDLDNNLKNIVK